MGPCAGPVSHEATMRPVDTTLTRLGMKMLYFRIFIAFLTSRERRLEAARAPSGCLDTDRVTHSQWLLEQRKSIRLL